MDKLEVTAVSQHEGGDNPHETHEAGMDIDIETPSNDDALRTSPSTKLNVSTGSTTLQLELMTILQVTSISLYWTTEGLRCRAASATRKARVCRHILHEDAYADENCLWSIRNLIVDNPKTTPPYCLERVGATVKAFTNLQHRRAPWPEHLLQRSSHLEDFRLANRVREVQQVMVDIFTSTSTPPMFVLPQRQEKHSFSPLQKD